MLADASTVRLWDAPSGPYKLLTKVMPETSNSGHSHQMSAVELDLRSVKGFSLYVRGRDRPRRVADVRQPARRLGRTRRPLGLRGRCTGGRGRRDRRRSRVIGLSVLRESIRKFL